MTKMGHRGKLDILRDPDACVADFKRWTGTEVAPKFKKSITRGFAAVGQPNVAVCLLPGTEIAFDENVECEPSFGIGILANKKIGQRLARFRQVNMDNPVAHHDALEFPDGQLVLDYRFRESCHKRGIHLSFQAPICA